MDNYSKSLWVVEQLYRQESMSFRALTSRWEQSALYDGRPLSNSTFRRRIGEIAQTMNIEIVYDTALAAYTIANRDDIAQNAVYQYLLGAFHISSLASLAQKHRNRIQLQVPPTGVEWLHTILEAIDRGRSLIFKYRSYYAPADMIYNYEIIPCFVRLFEGRWYLIAEYLDHSNVRVLALERISELEIGDTACVASDEIDAEHYYTHCFGIIRDDQQPTTIRLKVTAPQDAYIRAQPLHKSQTEAEQTDHYTIFEYFMRPSFDLTQELLWQGGKVEVLAPAHYRAHIAELARNIAIKYELLQEKQ